MKNGVPWIYQLATGLTKFRNISSKNQISFWRAQQLEILLMWLKYFKFKVKILYKLWTYSNVFDIYIVIFLGNWRYLCFPILSSELMKTQRVWQILMLTRKCNLYLWPVINIKTVYVMIFQNKWTIFSESLRFYWNNINSY